MPQSAGSLCLSCAHQSRALPAILPSLLKKEPPNPNETYLEELNLKDSSFKQCWSIFRWLSDLWIPMNYNSAKRSHEGLELTVPVWNARNTQDLRSQTPARRSDQAWKIWVGPLH